MTSNVPNGERLRQLADEVCTREGCRLYDLEFVSGSKGRGRILRVLIDRESGGSSLDDCTNVSRGLSLLLDVEDLIPGEDYSLEVSSPGLERPLRLKWHFDAVVGSKVEVKTKDSLELNNPENPSAKNRTRITGKLVSVEPEGISLEAEGMTWRIPLDGISRAKRLFEFEATPMPGKKKK